MSKRGRLNREAAEAIELRRDTLASFSCSSSWVDAQLHHGVKRPDGLHVCLCCMVGYPSYYVLDAMCYDCLTSRTPARVLAQYGNPSRSRRF